MFDALEVLKHGNDKQQAAFRAIQELHIMEDLRDYHPLLCGTIPLGIDVAGSDLDIIMEVHEFDKFAMILERLFHDKNEFRIVKTNIRGKRVIKANFIYRGFEFELFGQAVPVREQHAFVHMQIENELLKKYPEIKSKIISLKECGVKTESAFCQVLGINGDDPYDDLIQYGKWLLKD